MALVRSSFKQLFCSSSCQYQTNSIDCYVRYCIVLYCTVYHRLSVSKHHDILPWLPWFKTLWYSKVSMVYHGILPWFTCFKTHMEYDGIFSQGRVPGVHNQLGIYVMISKNVTVKTNSLKKWGFVRTPPPEDGHAMC